MTTSASTADGDRRCDIRVFRGADVSTDHYPLVGKIRLKLKRSVKIKNSACPYAVATLKSPQTSHRYKLELLNRFAVLLENMSIEEKLKLFSTSVKASAETVIGRTKKVQTKTLDIRQKLEPYR